MDSSTERTERELLAEILTSQRKSLLHARITSIVCMAIAALMVILALIILPKAASAVSKAEDALGSLKGTLEKAEGLEEVFDGVKDFIGKLDGLVGESGALTDAAARLGKIDIDSFNSGIREICRIDIATLNKAITELSDVIQPLARLANMFN